MYKRRLIVQRGWCCMLCAVD